MFRKLTLQFSSVYNIMIQPHTSNKGLSFIATLFIGVVVSFFIIISLFLYTQINSHWSPSTKSADKFLKKKKYDKALAVIDECENANENSALLVEKGKVWMTLAWEKENREGWSSYGVNDTDWLESVESDSAEKFFKMALSKFPTDDNRDARYYLAILNMEKGRYSTAETLLLEILANNKDDADVRNILGVTYVNMKLYTQALREFKISWKLDNKQTSTVKNIATIYKDYIKEPDSAVVWISRFLSMDIKRDSDAGRMRIILDDLLKRYPEYADLEIKSKRLYPSFNARGESVFGRKR